MPEADLNFPDWTDYAEKGGLDPLGMQNSSVALYQRLIPGIGNVTLRVRYYGFYPWLVRHYLQTEGSTDPDVWKLFLRKAEALFALIAVRAGGETGVAGTIWATKELKKRGTDLEGPPIDFTAAAVPGSDNHYFAQSWGVFGLAYQSQLYEIGILSRGEGHAIPLPSEREGMALADGFEAALGDAGMLFKTVHRRGIVTLEELDALAPVAPSQIAMADSERDTYQSVLFAADGDAGENGKFRQRTLKLLLKVAELLGRSPSIEELRWVLYAGQSPDGQPLELDADLARHCVRWRIYQANDLCHIAFETLLKCVLDRLRAEPAGIAPRLLTAQLVGEIRDASSSSAQTWRDLIQTSDLAANPNDQESPLSERRLTADIMRVAGQTKNFADGETGWKAIQLLAILHRRSREEAWPLEDELGPLTSDIFHSLLSERAFLERCQDEGLWTFIGRLIEERVIQRHLFVALRKLRQQRDYTFLIESEEGRLRCRKLDGPVYTNPRLGPAITFLTDIHVLSGQGLTDYGVGILAAA